MTTGVEALSGAPAAPAAPPPAPGAEPPAAPAQTPAEPAAPAGAEPPAAPAVASKWYDGLPAERHEYIANKGWASPADVLDSYTSLEKTLGLPADAKADALLVRPKADATPEDAAAFIDKAVGAYVPAEAKDYDLGITLKEGESLPPELEQARNWMKEAGVPGPMAPKLVAAYQADLAKAEAAFEAQSLTDMQALAAEFGDKSEDNFELGRRAFRAAKEQSGIEPSHLAAMERAIGTKAMMKLFVGFGKNLVEAPGGGPPGNAGNPNGGFVQTAEGAKAKIAELTQDSAFMARYNSPNIGVRKTAIDEMEVLQKRATGTA